jgi:hypothetical protein
LETLGKQPGGNGSSPATTTTTNKPTTSRKITAKPSENTQVQNDRKAVVFNKSNDCFDAMGLHHMAQLRRQKECDNVHQGARQLRKKKEEQAPELTDQKSPNDVPRDPPPPTRDKRVAPRVGRTNTDDQSEGKQRLLMQPQPLADMHPLSKTLHEWQQGIQVDCGPNWTWEACEAAVERGPHPSAATPDSIKLFSDDIRYQEKAGF